MPSALEQRRWHFFEPAIPAPKSRQMRTLSAAEAPMFEKLQKFQSDESAAVAIEYALIAVFVGLAIISSISLIAPQLNSTFTNVTQKLASALAASK
jgi:Flp pilus assembly pilin Flp